MEIERKWLFTKEQVEKLILGENLREVSLYWQAYLSISPEVRIRKKQTLEGRGFPFPTYGLTIKGDGILSRPEVNLSLTEDQFDELLKVGDLNLGDFIFKELYNIELGKYVLTIGAVDVSPLEKFYYGEIEFETEEEANGYIPSFEYFEDVTNDPSYKMKNMWCAMRRKRREII